MSFHIFPSSVPTTIFHGRIALFDVDGTLIQSKSGRRYADSVDDWIFTYESVPDVLHSYYDDGWTVALISNQSVWNEDSRSKLESVLKALHRINGWVPWCLVATGSARGKNADTVYRKPARGLYDVLLRQLGRSECDIKELCMCGDAVGAEDPSPAYRWADSDRGFARNIGATFLRPCDVFPRRNSSVDTITLDTTTQEVVILVGNPGSGKSTTGKAFAEAGYVHVEQDTLKNKSETQKHVKHAIASGRSVVVDATHGSREIRSAYIDMARQMAIGCRIVWHPRDGRPYNALREKPVPEIAYVMYTKHFQDPRDDGVRVEIIE
jgi:bifunctional polynucleotide phosphatase/kinase